MQLWCNAWTFRIIDTKPIPKFHKTFINFEKPQKNFKNPKPRSKCVKCMKNEWKRDHTKWFEIRKGWKSHGFEVWERRKCLGGEKIDSVKKDQGEVRRNHADPLHRKTIKLDRLKGVERVRDLKSVKRLSKSCPRFIKRCPQLEDLDGSRSYRGSIKHPESFSMDQAAIKKLSRMR